ncbi:type III-B CRISPR module-associated Cmr3 family protein [Leadbettera azotonutricia]|uniref:CRISPR-associated protein Cmr3 n=1 Tax=Leadbettera azotonutricia (strain ATCC BAA-888 / DSM 13862 / ZAS-9) TaxID=545695 RepID=F5YD02_LEAAZ|nr:type III-B CRISPR module-associated Cmr3 family protein [Leadbettera azotonutricia]AEF82060.1 conserved hypothetical protein [Leadbettera azotonutricia ZAS-9]
MDVCYTFKPLDTLFFRGNTPMEAGQIQSLPLFPPPVSVISGAVRTAILNERHISFEDYKNGKAGEIEATIGKYGSDSTPFTIDGILVKKGDAIYAPAPALWYIDTKEKLIRPSDYIGKKVVPAKLLQEDFSSLDIESSEGELYFVVPKEDAQPMKDLWVSLDFIVSDNNIIGKDDIILRSDIFSTEMRIGIGIDEKRSVIQGALYSAQHIRLKDDIELLVLFDRDCGLKDKGALTLGGERRICSYKKIDFPLELGKAQANSSSLYVSLAPIEATQETVGKIAASQKLFSIAGWDLAKGFHKSTKNWIPAGAVFQKKVNSVCIPLGNK